MAGATGGGAGGIGLRRNRPPKVSFHPFLPAEGGTGSDGTPDSSSIIAKTGEAYDADSPSALSIKTAGGPS